MGGYVKKKNIAEKKNHFERLFLAKNQNQYWSNDEYSTYKL